MKNTHQKNFYKWKFNYEDYHKYKTYSYYDSILFVDYVISSIINYMKKYHKNFIIYFTSDHAEMLGFADEKGKYGHSQLVFGDTYVPFLYYSDKFHKNLNKVVYNPVTEILTVVLSLRTSRSGHV